MKNLIVLILLLLSTLWAEKVEITLTSGESFAIYPSFVLKNDTLYASVLNFKTIYLSDYPIGLMGESMHSLTADNLPESVAALPVEAVSSVRIVTENANPVNYLVGVFFGTVIGLSSGILVSTSEFQGDRNINTAFLGAAGMMSGYFIGDYIDRKNRKRNTSIFELGDLNTADKSAKLIELLEIKSGD